MPSFMRALILYLSFGLLILGVLAFGGVEILYSWRIRPLIEHVRSIQDRHEPTYLDDLIYLSKFPLLAPTSGRSDAKSDPKSDAGTVLNPKLFWSPASASGSSEPLIPGEVREELLRLKGDWIRQTSRVKAMAGDLSFFSGLGRFDYWDIETKSPIQELIESTKFVPQSRLPVPEVSDLLAATKLRLLQANLDGKMVEALQDVRQFARLLLTTESLQLVIAGLTVLDHERRAYRHFVDEKGLPPDSWLPVDRNLTRRAHRTLLATSGYLKLVTGARTIEKVFLGPRAPIGFCAVINDSIPFEYSLKPLLLPLVPFELDNRDAYARLDRIFDRARGSCRIKYLRRLAETETFSSERPGPFLLNRLPFTRRVFGMKAEVAKFGGFDAYSQAAAGTVPLGN